MARPCARDRRPSASCRRAFRTAAARIAFGAWSVPGAGSPTRSSSICDFAILPLSIEGSPLEARVRRLHDELAARNLRLRPHCWLSNAWFSPAGVTGFAIPFYLAHPRLVRLETSQMLEVEGATEAECMQLMRHEAGHALDTAFGLHRRAGWRRLFGRFSAPYRNHYVPGPISRDYVLHLDPWYAQSHPAEDFCETFAIWLTPGSRWRRDYRGWPALEKLEYVDRLMTEIAGRRPGRTCRERTDPLSKLRTTLRAHYARKRKRTSVRVAELLDGDLRRVFPSKRAPRAASEPAARFLERHARALRKRVAVWSRESQYTIDEVLRGMITRCRELGLERAREEHACLDDATLLLTVQTMHTLHGPHYRRAR